MSLIHFLFRGSFPVGALKVSSLSHHSFNRFAAFKAFEASSDPVENEASPITSHRVFNKTEEDGQLKGRHCEKLPRGH